MKTKLIKLEYYNIIVSGEDIKEGWKGLAFKTDVKGYVFEHFYTENKWYNDAKMIIASENPKHNLLSINYNGLGEEFGIFDVDKLAEISSLPKKFLSESPFHEKHHKEGFIEGFKKNQSLNDKKFSLDDIRNAFDEGLDSQYEEDNESIQGRKENYIQSLQQPKVYDIEGIVENDSFKITKINKHSD